MIPNAIGGRKKVTGFICRTCNSQTGSQWDNELARQLAPISLLLGIKRQHGPVPAQIFQTSNGSRVRIHPDGTMVRPTTEPQVKTEGSTTSVHIEASTRRELRRIVEGFRRKFPQLRNRELEELVADAQDESFYSPDLIGIPGPMVGPEFRKAMVKSALALVFDAGIDPKQCDVALDFLLHDGGEACIGEYYHDQKDVIPNRPPKSPFHCVYVEGCSETGTIVGYVELFSLVRGVLWLSQSYIGKDFNNIYAIDPVSGEEPEISVRLDLSMAEIKAACDNRKVDQSSYIGAISALFDVIVEKDSDRALERVIHDTVQETIASCGFGEGDDMTDAQKWRFTQEFVTRVMPFMIHQMTPMELPAEILLSPDKG